MAKTHIAHYGDPRITTGHSCGSGRTVVCDGRFHWMGSITQLPCEGPAGTEPMLSWELFFVQSLIRGGATVEQHSLCCPLHLSTPSLHPTTTTTTTTTPPLLSPQAA
ncbi:hypothetical protein EYF80_012203 [Liparis tanakae]|uniref:Uncharacterized protein n=1 Tax=Liparis tanakae TaxID=230148 RepID=A0A4Z2IKC5_9TELE|nr:hypothetical protein EYF80_012203 [Liparis tanakae]